MDFYTAKHLARAHGLAVARIGGIRQAKAVLHEENELFTVTIHACIGYCQTCDSYWQVFRRTQGLILEVVDVGVFEPPAPDEAESLPNFPQPGPPLEGD